MNLTLAQLLPFRGGQLLCEFPSSSDLLVIDGVQEIRTGCFTIISSLYAVLRSGKTTWEKHTKRCEYFFDVIYINLLPREDDVIFFEIPDMHQKWYFYPKDHPNCLKMD